MCGRGSVEEGSMCRESDSFSEDSGRMKTSQIRLGKRSQI